MSLLAILYNLVAESPILVAFNQDEPAGYKPEIPAIHSGKPRILASVELESGGTSLGVNQNGMLAGFVSRNKRTRPNEPESRRKLVRKLLKALNARKAMNVALDELSGGQYLGANFVIADQESGWVVHGGETVESCELENGLTIVGSTDIDDPRNERSAMAHRLLTLQNLDSPIKFLAVASKVFARGTSVPNRPTMITRRADFGTVSSTLVALGTKPRDAIYQFAAGSPDEVRYEDYSPLLRDILSRGIRESRSRVTTV
jgi:uncharacterized protein with NRDE domain